MFCLAKILREKKKKNFYHFILIGVQETSFASESGTNIAKKAKYCCYKIIIELRL